jgi:hypothetical protein
LPLLVHATPNTPTIQSLVDVANSGLPVMASGGLLPTR